MEPNLKLVLEEIQKSKEEFGRRFDEHNEQWERRFANLDLARAARDTVVDKCLDAIELAGADTAYTISRCVVDLEAVRIDPLQDERDDRVTALEVAATDLGTWRPEMEALVDDLRIEMQKLSQGREPMVFDVLPQWPVFASSSSAPSGHGDASSHRDGGFGTGAVWTHVPVMGKQSDPPPPPLHPRSTPPLPHRPPAPPYPSPHLPPHPHPSPHPPRPPPLYIPPRPPLSTPRHPTPHDTHDLQRPTGRLPKLPFSKFDGENPRLWRSRCERYFTMYAVDPSLWVSIATMYVEGTATG